MIENHIVYILDNNKLKQLYDFEVEVNDYHNLHHTTIL